MSAREWVARDRSFEVEVENRETGEKTVVKGKVLLGAEARAVMDLVDASGKGAANSLKRENTVKALKIAYPTFADWDAEDVEDFYALTGGFRDGSPLDGGLSRALGMDDLADREVSATADVPT